MELRHLRYFVAVATEQNITRAATRLRVAQPSLSRQIRDLEYELGFALFEHASRAIRLTAAGRTFLEETKAVLQYAEDAVRRARAVAEGKRGEIHLGYAPSLTVGLVPSALRLFERSKPGVRVHLHDLSTQEMLQRLHDGKLDIALLVRPSEKALRGLVFRDLLHLACCVAVAPSHRLARVQRVGMEQVARERLVTYSQADYPEHHEWIASLFAPLDLPPQIAEEHDSSTSLMAAVEAGRGVALVQDGLQALAGSRLKVRPLSPAPPPIVVGVAYRERDPSPATDKFVYTLLSLKKAPASERELSTRLSHDGQKVPLANRPLRPGNAPGR